MSGPVSAVDARPDLGERTPAGAPTLELSAAREATVGTTTVRRALPKRGRRTVGAWCFADHFGPTGPADPTGMQIGPHPHIGLATVTWLLDGTVVHRDSLGSEQLIRPDELNLMTAGRGVVHSEETPPGHRGSLHGLQLWVAQPDATRHGAPAFEHHGELPLVELGAARVTVLVGSFDGHASPARADTPLVGLDVALQSGTTVLPLHQGYEHALVVSEGAVAVVDHTVAPGVLGYLGRGRDELPLTAREPARVLLLGGEPFGEPVLMWWNFVARTRDEMDAAYQAWASGDDRFGPVASSLARIPAPRPPWPGQSR
jgi:quercetin 2,3-dioxygenase